MKRREAIRSTALMMGGLLSTSTLSIIMEACSSPDKKSEIGTAKKFTESEKEIITRIADIIIPDTDTPGAVAAEVPDFIISMMQDTFPEEDQNNFHAGLAAFNEWSKDNLTAAFVDLSENDQVKAVEKLDEMVLGKNDEKHENLSFYRVFKELTLLGFFTSETGATQTLRYVQIPGDYDGCMPYKKGDKTWASA